MEELFYFAELLDSLNDISLACLVLSGIVFIASSIGYAFSKSDDERGCSKECSKEESIDTRFTKKLKKFFGIILVISIVLFIIVPSKDTVYLMMSGRIVDQTIENNPQVKEIPEKTVNLVNAWLDKELREIKDNEE